MDRPSAEVAARLWAKFRRSECNSRELALLAQLFGRFGANPSDRSKVQVPKKPEEPTSGFGRLVGAKRPA
jgi:hypothetical protein